MTSNSRQVVSGGGEGQVRVWDIFKQHQEMKSALKEHKGKEWSVGHSSRKQALTMSVYATGAITCIKIRRDDQQVSVSKQSVVIYLGHSCHM